jgi:hypothetical protein
MTTVVRKRLGAAMALMGALLLGCASAPKLPTGLDPAQVQVEPSTSVRNVQLEEAGWKSRSAQTGGWVGLGVGFGVGGMACMGAGFLAPLCLATLVPLTTVVGAVGGAAAGAAQSHRAPGVEQKQGLLEREWSALAGRAPLEQSLQGALRSRTNETLAPPAAAPTPAPWRMQAGYATLGTVGSGADQPFLLQATATLTLWRPGEQRAVAEKVYVAQSADRLTLAQWSADDAQALRRTLDELSSGLATQMVADVMTTLR